MATEREEHVVLVDERGHPVGRAEKRTVHQRSTPRHLGFSCYGFDGAGRLLVTQRAAEKATFPGVWSNTCCGHPAPGERVEQAVRRRLSYELDLVPENLGLVLAEFSYRASFGDVEENELCPVFVCRLTRDPSPRRAEVQAWQWWTWEHFLREVADADSNLSPWARLQAPLLQGLLPTFEPRVSR